MTWNVGDIGWISQKMARESSCGRFWGRVRVVEVRESSRSRYVVHFIDKHGHTRHNGENWFVKDIDGPDPLQRATIEEIDEPAGPSCPL